MIKRILAALVGLSLTSLVFAQSPPLFFKEVWTINGAAHAIAPGETVVTNANLELKLYGPSATASDPDKRIWISTPPTNIWTGMTTTPFAATLRDKENYESTRSTRETSSALRSRSGRAGSRAKRACR
jgi:hypothetical protein